MTVGYVMSRYPLLSETFILREIWALEQQGHDIRILPLRDVPQGPRHERVAQLRAPVWRAPWLSLGPHLRQFGRRPRAYLATLGAVLWYNRGDWNLWLGAVAYWGKAVAIAEYVERHQIERVHAHYATHPAMVADVARQLTGVRYSFTVHAHDIFCHRAMLAQKLDGADRIIAISEYNRRLLTTVRPQAAPKIEVVHCGVEHERFAALAAARGRPATTAGPHAGRLRILSVGSLQAYKGHRYLIDACARIRDERINFECRILGGGKLMSALRKQIAGLGLDDTVRLLGPGDEAEVERQLGWAQVFAMPSVIMARTGQMEGIPVALMEAMAAGLAVVATKISGIPELIDDGESGLLASPGDADGLAKALISLGDEHLRCRLGQAGRRRIEQDFGLAQNAARLAQLWMNGAQTEPAAQIKAVA